MYETFEETYCLNLQSRRVAIQQVTRMNNRMPKIMLNYWQNGRRRLGRPLKRLLDDAETGLSRSNSWTDDDDDVKETVKM